ncbi:MAG: hypothetical protein A3A80_02950 [Candidatus Terrybacteria bacterium RIFCSPLOWO2_01_FULL_44_24]|uniref:Uncharacterized protein n=1 Tax=Candidatus Terrybacteria bacterium RIFCSPHIGHO2_01_FULL_43_35 TaxID=1802361 RepID=A0A1G2PGZ5_9BACT|nr:MAG: hypothetical protein A2828_03135 [Candidatus Terrybacteria bacterium RIFCSPHIGHO2_01_FULL_43_35]OHA51022.1 MAG: hypothetical protein A3A80_02950 [Candidatus Terrybacteria bacterium RIFCSPLOWO2_01_FULL_44_24]
MASNNKNIVDAVIDKLNDLEFEGINLTRRAHEDSYIYWENPNHLEDVFRDYNLWRQKIKDFILNNQINSDLTGFFLEGDSVSPDIGLYEYRIDKGKTRKLLKNIRNETSKKLGYLRKLKRQESDKISINKLKENPKRIYFDETNRQLKYRGVAIPLLRGRRTETDNLFLTCRAMCKRKPHVEVSWDEIAQEEKIHDDAGDFSEKAKGAVRNAVMNLNRKSKETFGLPLFRWHRGMITRLY